MGICEAKKSNLANKWVDAPNGPKIAGAEMGRGGLRVDRRRRRYKQKKQNKETGETLKKLRETQGLWKVAL